ncbi:aspartyl-tRNA(Asn)/glutamyl-tRNA(Gln) amidotransferase subunit A [Kibdelosporangium banguiense]|uniref:Aspartyl-tRNA(Asn)/glutamyl-tRNA(Gln) amidotransferase subunit A n=1 Tax=Kibdelosporangium banguiense TaxID=1365924 RepID=A0ABS4TS46_9PSEU|nr:amidase [Kibdelosporangium banguiense]MBP2327228.1 aspartyl-tRNA(Asn)/glutamyl-tRNA(Gln) amidotransferase subunit A [Kibdelosporangium banguiense]
MQPYQLTITETARLFRLGDLSPVELMDSVLDRIEALDGLVGAFATVTAERARSAAVRAEHALVNGVDLGLLHGIPMGVKDIVDTAGVLTTSGSAVRADHVPTADAEVVRRLADAGALLVGKTHTHEFAYGLITPTTRNPWNLAHIPGGSSGGSAAAVAAGLAQFAIGTDTGGSIRVPAALCGVVGLKPTYGSVSRHGVTPLAWSLDTVGPITRSVADAGHVLSAISSPLPVLTSDVRGLTVGIPVNHFFDRVAPDVATVVHRMAGLLMDAGAEVREVTVPDTTVIGPVFWTLITSEASAYHEEVLRTKGALYQPDVHALLEQGQQVTAVDYVKAQRVRAYLKEQWKALFADIDVLISPTVASTAPLVGQTNVAWHGSTEDVTAMLLRLTCAANVTGQPALSVPCGLGDDALPVGIQVTGRPFTEDTVLRVGHVLEQVSELTAHTPVLVGS